MHSCVSHARVCGGRAFRSRACRDGGRAGHPARSVGDGLPLAVRSATPHRIRGCVCAELRKMRGCTCRTQCAGGESGARQEPGPVRRRIESVRRNPAKIATCTHTRPQADTPGQARSAGQGDVKAGGSDPPAMGSGRVWGCAAGVLGGPLGADLGVQILILVVCEIACSTNRRCLGPE